jgi:hypothetical protein
MRYVSLLALCGIVALTGCEKKKPKAVAKKDDAGPAVAEPAPVDNRNSAYVQGGGALQNARQAAKRAVAMSDMQQLGTLIFSYELDNNKMPTASDIKAMLKPDGLNILKLIDEGAIILTGTTDKRGLWAYEVDADTAGGVIVTGPTPAARRATADEVKGMLGK